MLLASVLDSIHPVSPIIKKRENRMRHTQAFAAALTGMSLDKENTADEKGRGGRGDVVL